MGWGKEKILEWRDGCAFWGGYSLIFGWYVGELIMVVFNYEGGGGRGGRGGGEKKEEKKVVFCFS